MKALSIRQPWAWAIIHGGKRVENRDWKGCAYRGEVLIHASKWPATSKGKAYESFVDEALSAVRTAQDTGWPLPKPACFALRDMLDSRGGIVGIARIVDVLEHEAPSWIVTETERIWWTGGFALVLDDVRPLPLIPCVGALGLFNVPPPVAGAVRVARNGA